VRADLWSDDRMAELRRLWVDTSLSSRDIAARLGMSNGAVCGKARRLGLPMRVDLGRRNNGGRKFRQVQPVTVAAVVARRTPAKQGKAVSAAPPVVPPSSTHGCKWIEGDPRKPGWAFCGAKSVSGQSWCAAHMRRVFKRQTDGVAA
jgi:GcrA cell cycle regulator